MIVTKIETIPFKIPLISPLKWGLSGYLEAAEHVLVKIHTDQGIIGVAEATPRPSICGASLRPPLYSPCGEQGGF